MQNQPTSETTNGKQTTVNNVRWWLFGNVLVPIAAGILGVVISIALGMAILPGEGLGPVYFLFTLTPAMIIAGLIYGNRYARKKLATNPE